MTSNENREPDLAYIKPFHPVSDDQPAHSRRFGLDYIERVLHFAALMVLIVLSFFSVALYIPVFLIGYCIGKRLNPMFICGFWIIVGIIAAPPFVHSEGLPSANLEWLICYVAMGITATLCGMRYKETHYRRYVYLPAVLWLIIFWFGRLSDAYLPFMQN